MDVAQEVSIGPASPSPCDDRIADLIWDVDPPLMRFLFRDSHALWRRLVQADWGSEDGWFSHRNAILARLQDRIAGVMVAMTASAYERSAEITLRRWCAVDEGNRAHPPFAFESVNRLFPKVPDDAFYVFDLVVAQEARGAGIGRLLMDAADGLARRAGCRSVHLDTAADNPAVAFYRRLGFEVLIETRVPYLAKRHGIPTHVHMMKALD